MIEPTAERAEIAAQTVGTAVLRVVVAVGLLSRKHSYPPTVREIGNALGLRSNATVATHLDVAESRGLIARGEAGKSRTVTVMVPDAVIDLWAHALGLRRLARD